MAFREVTVIEIREVLRLWLRGDMGLRPIAETAGCDRKTARRYVEAAVEAGLDRQGGVEQLSDELIGVVVEAVRPARLHGRGRAWERCAAHHDWIKEKVDGEELRLTKVHQLLERRGVKVPYRTLHRYASVELGFGRRGSTVRVADCEPGQELQVDFGRLGLIFDPETSRRRLLWALVFTSVFSRHMFVWVSFSQTVEEVIDGFEAAWQFFGGSSPW